MLGMRNVTHLRLFWLHFPSPSRQETFSSSQRGKQKPELKVDWFFFFLHTITLKERKPYGDWVIILLVTAFRWLQIKKKDCQQMHPSILPLLHLAYYNAIAAMPTSKRELKIFQHFTIQPFTLLSTNRLIT